MDNKRIVRRRPVTSDYPIVNLLDQRISRRRAIGTGVGVAAGVVGGLVIGGAVGYLARGSGGSSTTTVTTSGAGSTVTQTVTSTASQSASSSASSALSSSSSSAAISSSSAAISSSSSSSAISSSSASSLTSTPAVVGSYVGVDTTFSGATASTVTWDYYWSKPSDAVNFLQWAFRSDLVSLGVQRYMEQMNENVNHTTGTGSYDTDMTNGLLAANVDVCYIHPQDGATAWAAGLLQDISGITADYPNGRIIHSVSDIKAEINAGYPGFITDFSTPTGTNFYGLPYFQTILNDVDVNGVMAVKAGIQDATNPYSNSWPTGYMDMWNSLPAIQSAGYAQNPYLPGAWWVPSPGDGMSTTIVTYMEHLYGPNSMYSNPPNITPTFDTNTSISDLLKQMQSLYNNNLVWRAILTTTNEADVNGEFGSGNHLYFEFQQYELEAVNDPSTSKIAGNVYPVPGATTNPTPGWGYTNHAGMGLSANVAKAKLERAQAFLTWFGYKDRSGEYFEGLNIDCFGGISALTGYVNANNSKIAQDALATAVPDPAHNVPVLASVAQGAITDFTNTQPWAGTWLIDLTSNIPAFITGTQDLNTTITTLRTDLDNLISKYSSTTG